MNGIVVLKNYYVNYLIFIRTTVFDRIFKKIFMINILIIMRLIFFIRKIDYKIIESIVI